MAYFPRTIYLKMEQDKTLSKEIPNPENIFFFLQLTETNAMEGQHAAKSMFKILCCAIP